MSLAVPPALLDAIAERVVEQLADRLATPEPESWLGVEEAARYLDAPVSRVYDLVSMGRVRHARDGRRLLFRRADLDAALDVTDPE